jgi:hypothetical protein
MGPLGVVSGPIPMGPSQSQAPGVVNSQGVSAPPAPPLPPPIVATPAQPLPPPPAVAPPPADPTAIQAPPPQITDTTVFVDQSQQVQADFIAGDQNLVAVVPIDNSVSVDPSANSGDQPQV